MSMKDDVKKVYRNKTIKNIQVDQYGYYRIIFNGIILYYKGEGFSDFIFDLIARWFDNKSMKCKIYSDTYLDGEELYLKYDNDEISVKIKYKDTMSKWKDITYELFHKDYDKANSALKLWHEVKDENK